MFSYFHQVQFLGNKKGQLVPIFIVILVVLIIMAFVTVNLSKVALFKTESANAADAGALAGGSVMANVFNGIAQQNSQMETYYWSFYTAVSVSFIWAIKDLVSADKLSYSAISTAGQALSSAWSEPCTAIGYAAEAALIEAELVAMRAKFIADIQAIMVGIMAYSVATNYHYRSIKENADKGRIGAIKMAHRFAFTNSNIGAKLKEGKPPAGIIDRLKKNNYRDEFSKFLDEGLDAANPEYTYAWEDGAGRQHYVKTKVAIDPVNFKLKTTIFPWPVEIALLETATGWMVLFMYIAAAVVLIGACICSKCCPTWPASIVCCPCWWVLSLVAMILLIIGIVANILTQNSIVMIFTIIIPAWAGLLPGPVVPSDSGNDMSFYTICWIDDVDHNRKVRVDTWQHHEGANLGVWETRYPETHSFSVVDFTGHGSIHPVELKFDPSVVSTDALAGANPDPDPEKLCGYAKKHIAELEVSIDEALGLAVSYDAQAQDLEAEAARLITLNMADVAEQISASAATFRDMAAERRQQVDLWQKEVEEDTKTLASCVN